MSSGICVWYPSDTSNQRNFLNKQYHLNIQKVGWVIRYPFHSLHSGYEIRVSSSSTLTTVTIWNRLHDGHIVWGWLWCSLVLFGIFKHPYPTLVLVVLSSAKSIERTHLDCLGNLISHLFIRRGCVRMRKSENNFSFSGVAMHRQTAGYKPVQPVGIP